MRFTILTAPGSDPGDARARASAVVAVDGPAAIAAAAAASRDAYMLVLAEGARPLPGAFGGLTAALEAAPGVLGGTTHAGGMRWFGWMLAPAAYGPLPFEPVPIAAPASEPGVDALVRGPVDVVAPGMFAARRELLLEPLPAEPVARLTELCARARAAGMAVVCRPAFACEAPVASPDDRGRAAALRDVAERRPELVGVHRLAPGLRQRGIEREVRLAGGRLGRVRVAAPSITLLVHGTGAELAARRARSLIPAVADARATDDPAAALRAEMRVRGDRYVLLAHASRLPDADELERLVAALEGAPFVAVAATRAGDLDGSCVLLAIGRFPQHVEAAGATLAEAVGTLVAAARSLRRAVRAPGFVPGPATPPQPRAATVVFLASSLPEITRMSLDAVLAALSADDELVAIVSGSADTVRRLFAAHPHVAVETDAIDPLLTVGANRAIGAATRELVIVIADDVLLSAGALARVRSAFERVPSLGAALAAVPGAPGGEGVADASYGDISQLRAIADARARTRARELEPIDVAVTPAIAVAREAFEAVGGIDPAFGPTRRGIADLVARLRAAGYGAVRCDDALAHRFDVALSRNPAAAADQQQPVPAAPDAAWLARGFDPAHRVPFVRAGSPTLAAPAEARHTIAVPVAGPAELERAALFLAAAAATFDAAAPVRVHVLLDGTVSAADAVARMRPVLAARGLPLDETVTVRVERQPDLARWRDALEPAIRLVVADGHERAALDGVPRIAATALGSLLDPVAR